MAMQYETVWRANTNNHDGLEEYEDHEVFRHFVSFDLFVTFVVTLAVTSPS